MDGESSSCKTSCVSDLFLRFGRHLMAEITESDVTSNRLIKSLLVSSFEIFLAKLSLNFFRSLFRTSCASSKSCPIDSKAAEIILPSITVRRNSCLMLTRHPRTVTSVGRIIQIWLSIYWNSVFATLRVSFLNWNRMDLQSLCDEGRGFCHRIVLESFSKCSCRGTTDERNKSLSERFSEDAFCLYWECPVLPSQPHFETRTRFVVSPS